MSEDRVLKTLLRKFLGIPAAGRVAVGTDIVWIPEIQASIARFGERYLRFIFTPDEIAYCRRGPTDVGFAGRFAAKEAMMKLLRPRRDELLPWRSIEVQRTPTGVPELRLHGEAAAMARAQGIQQLTVSLSHDRDYATAVVVAMCKE